MHAFNTHRRRTLGWALALGASPLLASAQNKPATKGLPEIEFAYPEQPPRVFTNAQGQPDGVIIRLAGALFAKAGIPWHAVSYPAPRLIANLKDGNSTFSVLVPGLGLEESCLYGSSDLFVNELRAFHLGKKPTLTSKEDLRGKEFITMAGFSYGGWIHYLKDPANKITTYEAKTHRAAFDMLEAGRAPYVLDYALPVETDVLSQRSIPELNYGVLDRVYSRFVISKSYPDAEKVLARLEALYKSLGKDELTQLLKDPQR